ncbi:hypothetical protein T484DRAFT_1845756 [Baffinella frigidus]|nr:hypothetical protein T484DRAFT_1845756 [Cryptophyta sp. CCMP2293]
MASDQFATDTIACMASDILQFAMVPAVLVLAFMLMAHSMFATVLAVLVLAFILKAHSMFGTSLHKFSVLAVLVLAFMLMAHSMFGTSLRNFSNITDAAVSTIEFLMGNGDFFALSEADPIAAPIFYFPFVFVMIFVVLNITIAIIMDGYERMRDNREQVLVFVVLNITIAIIMDGYERMRDNREQMKTSHLKALAEKPFFTQVREYLLDLFSFAQV